MSRILVTGAAGYIGSHTCLELLVAGHDVIGIDNFDNSVPEAISRVEELAGRPLAAMFELDLRDRDALEDAFRSAEPIDAVIHFAGLKAVGQSVVEPMLYYDTNIGSTLALLDAMQRHGTRRLVFSSSCTVYGDPPPESMPLTEDSPLDAVNPYGRTKLLIEEMLSDLASSDPTWDILALRYFNPIGAHVTGRIGDDPTGIPNNLVPYIMQVAVGQRDELAVFGGDYLTPDGTCVRDYIHVVDVARGHLAALEAMDETSGGFEAVNLGTGTGSSVLEVIDAAGRAVGQDIPYSIQDRRAGDAASVYADPTHAQQRLQWKAEFGLQRMCDDHWRWQRDNPTGLR